MPWGSVFELPGPAVHRLHRGYLAGEVSHYILACSLHCWRLMYVSTQKFRRSIVRPELENLGCRDPDDVFVTYVSPSPVHKAACL